MPVDHGPAAELLARLDGDEKHEPSAYSTFAALHVLYDRVLDVDPHDPTAPDRDRFLLSKGHGPQAYYAMLAWRGFFPAAWLDGFAAFDSPLGHHPDRTLIPGVEISSGSLGHGLPLAVGVALALRAQGRTKPRVFCLIGDGELDEGSNHEAIAFAGRVGLDALTVIAIDNASATYGWPGGIAARFGREGWSTETVDGRDHDALERALTTRYPGQPNVVVGQVR
jgi:transketolase